MEYLKIKDPEEYAEIKALYDAVTPRITAPDYVRMAPPPENKAPFHLIEAWGLETFKLGLEIGYELANIEKEK